VYVVQQGAQQWERCTPIARSAQGGCGCGPSPSPGMSQDGCVEPTDRRYGDPLDDELPGTATDPPVTLIGYWEGDTEPGWPRMADVVDEHRDETNGTLWPRTWRKASGPGPRDTSWCRVCGKANGSAEHTDGVYLWPKRPCPLRPRAWRPPPGERYPPHPEQAGRSLPGAGRAGLMEDGDAGLLRGKTLTGVAAVLHARRHRPCHSQGAGQHDPPVHRLARQPRPRRPAPPIVNRANVA